MRGPGGGRPGEQIAMAELWRRVGRRMRVERPRMFAAVLDLLEADVAALDGVEEKIGESDKPA
jgi:hypothetical protein